VKPVYFGKAGKQLFGAYHEPRARRAVDAAVLLCYPLVQEYMRTHWAFRKLAGLLAREGFHVFRFDYSGTGDSAGDEESGSVAQWCADIRLAAAELQDLADVPRVSVVGLRMGAAFATLAVAGGLQVRDLVLWEPALDGRSHLRELEAIERIKFANLPHPPVPGPGELLEYPLPGELRASLEKVDLRRVPPCAADRVLVFSSEVRPEHHVLREFLRDRGGRPPQCQVVQEEVRDSHRGVLLSTRVLQAMASALVGGAW
jgi:pimeloyl-ACP methyl ester carboxylesterase